MDAGKTKCLESEDNMDDSCYMMLVKKADKLAIPEGWNIIQMDDYATHSHYPALVGEMMGGFVQIFGKQPDSGYADTIENNEDMITNDLLYNSSENKEEIKRVTLFSVSEADTYMVDMVRLLSSFQFDPADISAIATSLCNPTDRTHWTWLTRRPVNYKTVESIIGGSLAVPEVEFWHFKASRTSWKNIALAFQSSKMNIQKLILNDVVIDDFVIEHVAECIAAVRNVELTAFGRSSVAEISTVWETIANRILEEDVLLENLVLSLLDFTNETVDEIARCVANVKSVILVNVEMTKKQWARFAIEINRSDKKLRCLQYVEVEEIEPENTLAFARTISAVDEIILADVKITTDQWEEIGKEIKQPHSKLKKLCLYDMEFSNNEFAMFSRCVEDIPELEFSEINLSRSQWGVIGKKLSSPDIKTKKLLLTFSVPDKDSASALQSMNGFACRVLENGKTLVYEHY